MYHWTRRLAALAAPLLLTGCLWGPGKFTSDLALKKDGSFTLDYRGEIVLQLPPDADAKAQPWSDEQARCYEGVSGNKTPPSEIVIESEEQRKVRPCTRSEIASQRAEFEKGEAERIAKKRKDNEEMASLFGLPGVDDESSRAFAAKLMKYEGWKSVQFRGNGTFDVVYHFEGRATQDFLFPALPDNDLVIPFIAIRRRADGAVLVTAPSLVGGTGAMGSRLGKSAGSMAEGRPMSRAHGRFTVMTDGEILTNNSEDGAAPHPLGRQVHWDVTASSSKAPETLIRLR